MPNTHLFHMSMPHMGNIFSHREISNLFLSASGMHLALSGQIEQKCGSNLPEHILHLTTQTDCEQEKFGC